VEEDFGEWLENQILIPDWTYFHCPGATLVLDIEEPKDRRPTTASTEEPKDPKPPTMDRCASNTINLRVLPWMIKSKLDIDPLRSEIAQFELQGRIASHLSVQTTKKSIKDWVLRQGTTKNKNHLHQPTIKFMGFLPINFLPLQHHPSPIPQEKLPSNVSLEFLLNCKIPTQYPFNRNSSETFAENGTGGYFLESNFDSWLDHTLATHQCVVKIDEGQKMVHTNQQSNLRGSCQSIFSLCQHHPQVLPTWINFSILLGRHALSLNMAEWDSIKGPLVAKQWVPSNRRRNCCTQAQHLGVPGEEDGGDQETNSMGPQESCCQHQHWGRRWTQGLSSPIPAK